MKPDLLIISPLMRPFMEDLASRYTLLKYYREADKPAYLAQVAPRVRALITTGGTGLSADQIAALPNLEIAATMSVGYDAVDLPALAARGAKLTNTPDVLTDDVADTAIALMLCAWRDMMRGDTHVRSGAWGKGPLALNHRVSGAKIGIVGLGRIGLAIADRLAPMRAQIAYFGRSKKPVPYAFQPDLNALAAQSDILIVAAAGGPETAQMIDAKVLAALGPKGCLINIARGSVIDEEAMLKALESGALGMAGLDVFNNEPHIDPRFAALENVVLHPHHASGTVETRDAMAQMVVDNIDAFFAGRALISPVELPR
ncbi:MAG: 2-hydroxyacid dehydrogenase [Paracoccaceae bacterium]